MCVRVCAHYFGVLPVCCYRSGQIMVKIRIQSDTGLLSLRLELAGSNYRGLLGLGRGMRPTDCRFFFVNFANI